MGLQSPATFKISRVVSFRFDLPAVVALGMIWRASTLLADVTSLQCGEPRVVTEPGLRAFGNGKSTVPDRKNQTLRQPASFRTQGSTQMHQRRHAHSWKTFSLRTLTLFAFFFALGIAFERFAAGPEDDPAVAQLHAEVATANAELVQMHLQKHTLSTQLTPRRTSGEISPPPIGDRRTIAQIRNTDQRITLTTLQLAGLKAKLDTMMEGRSN